MSRRLAALAALAVVIGCAGCDAADLGSAKTAASSAGSQLTSDASKQLDAKTAEAKAAAADLTAQAQQAVKDQIAAAVKQATADAVKAAASAAASPMPSPAAVVAEVASAAPAVAVPVDATHTVTGTFTSPETADVSAGSVPCATETNVVGQQVSIRADAVTVTGVLIGCTWSAPGVLGSSPVFSLEVQKVPDAPSYDISIGDRTWQVSGTTLAASGWKVALT